MISSGNVVSIPAMANSPQRYVLILAGGSGTRFWPLSRNAAPKQLLRLFDEQTLLEKTILRLEGLVPLENILILTNPLQEAAVRAAASMLPAENILAEPEKRDTGPAVALGIGWVARRDPGAVMAILPSDHLIQDTAAFRATLDAAMEIAARQGELVTIGIRPTWACPGYGYVELGETCPEAASGSGLVPRRVACFKEKPRPEVAAEYVAAGSYLWNGGMFIWHLPVVRAELARHAPDLAAFVDHVEKATDLGGAVAPSFAGLTPISIDYALMEHSDRILNLEATFDWDDVGGWLSVAGYLPEDADGNRTRIPLSAIDASGNIIFSTTPQHVGLLGVKDLIVVQTEDALLVAHRDAADDIKKLVARVPANLH